MKYLNAFDENKIISNENSDKIQLHLSRQILIL